MPSFMTSVEEGRELTFFGCFFCLLLLPQVRFTSLGLTRVEGKTQRDEKTVDGNGRCVS